MIKDLYKQKKPLISFEVFPPKKSDDFPAVFVTLDELSALKPDFISVTYGAGGSNSKKTLEVASYIQNQLKIQALCHMTCVGYTKNDLADALEALKENNLENVLALRGDRPDSMSDEQYGRREFMYANEMVDYIRSEYKDTLCIGGACYPEKHPESISFKEDIDNLKRKIDAGLDFMTTQMFFDNELFYRFRETLDRENINIPISCGIMPITRAGQLGRSISLSGSSVPKKLSDIIALNAENPDSMYKAGIEYALEQINDLKANGVDGIHIYTMNKSTTASDIVKSL